MFFLDQTSLSARVRMSNYLQTWPDFAKWLSLGVIQLRLSPEDGQFLLNDSSRYSLPSAVLGGPSVYSRTDGRELRDMCYSACFLHKQSALGAPKKNVEWGLSYEWVYEWVGKKVYSMIKGQYETGLNWFNVFQHWMSTVFGIIRKVFPGRSDLDWGNKE